MRKSATGIDYAVASGMIVVVVMMIVMMIMMMIVLMMIMMVKNGILMMAIPSFTIESVAIDALDSQFKLERSVGAGEAIFISNRGELYTKTLNGYQDPSNVFAPCLFEYVYFARPDSVRVMW